MFGLWSSEAWPLSKLNWLVFLVLVVNVVDELQRKRTLAASRGFLAAARLSCVVKLLFAASVYSKLSVCQFSAST